MSEPKSNTIPYQRKGFLIAKKDAISRVEAWIKHYENRLSSAMDRDDRAVYLGRVFACEDIIGTLKTEMKWKK
jgi:hypothetical protein